MENLQKANNSIAKKIVQATIVLHNFIINNEEQMQLQHRYISNDGNHSTISGGLCSLSICQGRTSQSGIEVRNAFFIPHSLMEMVHYLTNG